MISVRLKVFGPLRDVLHESELLLVVPPPYTGESAFRVLASRYPELDQWKPSLRLAVNLTYVSLDHSLQAGDEISFIPPVSGG